jgi:integrase
MAWEKRLLEIVNQSNEKETPSLVSETKRILSNDEIRIVWQGLEMLNSDYSSRAMKLILVTGQEVSKCAALHRKEIISDAAGDWWQVEGGNKVYLTSVIPAVAVDPLNKRVCDLLFRTNCLYFAVSNPFQPVADSTAGITTMLGL